MYVKRIVLENIRGFDRLDFDFRRPDGAYAGWNVITGDNASGKTTLLRALALAMVGPDTVRALHDDPDTAFAGWVRDGQPAARVQATVSFSPLIDRFSGQGRAPVSQQVEPSVHFDVGTAAGGPGGPPDVTLPSAAAKRGPWAPSLPSGWFCAGYGPFRRLYGQSAEASGRSVGTGRVARFVTLFREDASLTSAERWLRDLHHQQLAQDGAAEAALTSVFKVLNDAFLRHEMVVHKVDPRGLWIRQASGALLPLAAMSEGYRAALAMLIDLLRHLHGVYGSLDTEDGNGRCRVRHPGVVLIDEADAHLHPEWQRQIGFWLKERLPEVQFIVTSHSPLLCQAADPNGLFHLPAPSSRDTPRRLTETEYRATVEATPDRILTSAPFGMRQILSPPVVEARKQGARDEARRIAAGQPRSTPGHALLLEDDED